MRNKSCQQIQIYIKGRQMIKIHIDFTDGTEISYHEGLKLLASEEKPSFTTNCLTFFSTSFPVNIKVIAKCGQYIDRDELMKNIPGYYTDREVRPGHNIYKMLEANSFDYRGDI